jgi:lipoate-protein ligase B
MRWAWLGRVAYRAAWELQEALRDGVLAGTVPETLLFLEHDPVITLGHSGAADHVLCSEVELSRRGIDLVRSSRGGDVTYHGPGQLVGYPIMRTTSVMAHVRGMAQAIIDACAELAVQAAFDCDRPGVWVGDDKLAAFGVHIRRGVAIHGFALNVTTTLDGFGAIVPCGLAGFGVTSLERLGALPPPLEVLAADLAGRLAALRGQQAARIDSHAILSV